MKTSTIMRGQIKGFETGAHLVNGRYVLLPHGQPALAAYPDPLTGGAPWTIGWGHTGKSVTRSTVITLALAEKLFDTDIAVFEHGVDQLIAGGAATSQGQYDALVSFAYNCGLDIDADTKAEGLGDSTLLKDHRAGNYAAAAAEFDKWTSHGNKGLVARRAMEKSFYQVH